MSVQVKMVAPGRAHIDVFIAAADSPTRRPLRVRKRLTSTTFEDAKQLAEQIESALLTNGMWIEDPSKASAHVTPEEAIKIKGLPPKARTLQAALDMAYYDIEEGWHRQRNGLKALTLAKEAIAIIGATKLCSAIVRADFAKVREELTRKGNSTSTVQSKLQALYRVLYFAQREEWITKRPAWKRHKLNNARVFTFNEETERQVLAFFEATEQHPLMADLFALGIDGGFRLNELLTLEGRRVDVAQSLVLIPSAYAKNAEFRQVVVLPRGMEILKRRIRDYGMGPLFSALNSKAVSDRMQAAREFMGEDDNKEFVFHATRHTHLSRLAAQGTPLQILMDQAGHKTSAMSMRYIHLAPHERVKFILERNAPTNPQAYPAEKEERRHERVVKLFR